MWTLIHQWLQPATPCLLCRAPVRELSGLCGPCHRDLPHTGTACPSCAMPMPGDACACSPMDWPFAAVLCAAHYEFPMDRLIRQYKESPRPELARPLARLMAQRIRRHPGPRPALLAPVPAADSRLRQRGFDQSRELARELGLLLKIPVRDDLFRRRDGLAAQKSLTAARREANMRDAFQPANLRNLPPHVALVDDVLTTGATARRLGALLHRAGVASVEVWAVARAL